MISHKLSFDTTHHQFYICDKASPFRTDSDDFWTTQAHDDKLAIEEGLLGVGTGCYGPVNGELQVLNHAPSDEDLSLYDHVVEGSLQLTSETLQIFACLDNTPTLEINLKPSSYRVRVYSSNLASVDGDAGDDYYIIKIWPATYLARHVLKRYSANQDTL